MIPTYEDLMRPVLEVLRDGQPRRRANVIDEVTASLDLTERDRAVTNSYGRPLTRGRVHWAISYMFKAGLLARPERATYRIAEAGQVALASASVINLAYLKREPQFAAWARGEAATGTVEVESDAASPGATTLAEFTPIDMIDTGVKAQRAAAIGELLEAVGEITPTQFERLVTAVVEGLGYAGGHGHGETTRQSSDGGVDGIIYQDRLGLVRILLQAKKWAPDNKVSRPEIDKSLGVLQRQGMRQGVFITTSSFTAEAREGVSHLGGQVALVDGVELANLMYEYGIGVSIDSEITTKRLDRDFFDNL